MWGLLKAFWWLVKIILMIAEWALMFRFFGPIGILINVILGIWLFERHERNACEWNKMWSEK